MRVLVCGGRDFADRYIIDALLHGMHEIEGEGLVVIEGGAKGADAMAAQFAVDYMAPRQHVQFPANWEKYGRAAGPIRNKQMLDEGKPDIVVAFPTGKLSDSKGTANMVAQAKAAGVPVYVIERH